MSELNWLSAAEIGAAYRTKRLSPVELAQTLLKTINTREPNIRAFIHIDAEQALKQASQAQAELEAGRWRGPLHGVPIALKDIIDVAGLPTTCHSKIMAGHVAKSDAHVVSQLRAAGAVLLGKLSLYEFAIGGPSFDLPYPPARNPWSTNYHPGGSSSGSGAALAAGMVPLALGTDTGGSIRNPAGNCGVIGLKPTYGLVSRHGVFPLAFSLDHVGPMARSVQDIALTLDVIAGFDARDPASAAVNKTQFGADINRGVQGLRIGYVRHFHEDDIVAHPEVGSALDEVANVLRQEGAQVRSIQLPRLQAFSVPRQIIYLSEAWAIHGKWLRERAGDYAEMSRRKLMPGAFMTASDYVQSQQLRKQLTEAVDDALRDVDVLMCVNSHDPSCRLDDEAESVRTYTRQARAPFNLTGHPALSMMSGLSQAGLPLAVQFVARAFDEATLLRVAAAYERVACWQDRRPPLT